MLKLLKINEIFYSIQGEGFRVGSANIFVRLAGCNRKCNFCDTDFTTKYNISIDNLIKKISKYKCKSIVWTGGEPTLQLTTDVIEKFFNLGYYQSLETNGSLNTPKGIDYISLSPKQKKINNEIKYVNEVRILYPFYYDKQAINNFSFSYDNLYLSPVFDGLKQNKTLINECIKLIKENPKWKISIQMQKLLKIQ